MKEEDVSEDFLTRDQILNADDLQFEIVEVPEWGQHAKVRVKGLSGTDRDAFETSLLITKKNAKGKDEQTTSYLNIRAKLCTLSIVDKHGLPMFTLQDVERLGSKSAAALNRVFASAQKLAAITDSDVEELVGNSAPDPGSAPSSL